MSGKKRKLTEFKADQAWTQDWQMTAYIMRTEEQKRLTVPEDRFKAYEQVREQWSKHLKALHESDTIEFVGSAWEICPQTGMFHEQCVLAMKKTATLATLKPIFEDWNSPHLEPLMSTPKQHWKEYCLKAISKRRQPLTHGDLPDRRGFRNDLERIHHLAALRMASPITTFQDGRPFSLQQLQLYDKLRLTLDVKRKWKTKVHWFYGETGSGKSLTARVEAGDDAYYVPEGGGDGQMDNYLGQENVVWDEFESRSCNFKLLLKILDRYPLDLKARYNPCKWIPKNIWITSREHPREVYGTVSDGEYAQLERRVEVIIRFIEKGKFVVEKNAKVQALSEEAYDQEKASIREAMAQALATPPS